MLARIHGLLVQGVLNKHASTLKNFQRKYGAILAVCTIVIVALYIQSQCYSLLTHCAIVIELYLHGVIPDVN